MAKRARNVNLFLMDGEVTERIKCTMSNWDGVVFKVPGKMLHAMKERDEFKHSGVYFLIGEDNGRDAVYVGQASVRKNGTGILQRLIDHTKDESKSFFNEVIVVTTQTNTYGATEISYLENCFAKLASEVGRYDVKNGNEPNPSTVTEEKEAELEEVVDNVKLIVGALGYRLFVPMIAQKVVEDFTVEAPIVFHLRQGEPGKNRKIHAMAEYTNEGVVVLKGSEIKIRQNPGFTPALKKRRDQLIAEGKIVGNVLQENQLFKSPSTAAQFVVGASANGKTSWKTENGRTFGEVMAEMYEGDGN